MRSIHQNVNGGERTGETPVQSFGILGGREDFDADRGWQYCLDAPELLPAGSVLPVNIPFEVGGFGYEGNVSSIVVRGRD